MSEVELYKDVKNSLGEGITWSSIDQSLLWVDIKPKSVLFKINLDNEKLETFDLPEFVTATSIISKNEIALVSNCGVNKFNFQSKKYERIINVEDKISSNRSNDGKTANVEFVSANPTGPLTIGHGRNGVIGDIISNILEWNGFSVTREYYFNNAGRQMRVLGESVKARYLELIGKPVNFPSNGYKGDYIKDIALKILKEKGNKLSDKEDSIFKSTAERLMFNDIKKTLSDLKINFDKYSNEKDYYDSGSIDKMLDEFKQMGYIYDKDGARWFNFLKLGHKQDKVCQGFDLSLIHISAPTRPY